MSKYDPSVIEPKWSHSAPSTSLRASWGKQKYNPSVMEPYWQNRWEEAGIYEPDLKNASKPFGEAQGKPFYNLMMFPYPSAEGLHVGNMYAFTGADIYGRFKRMQGYQVFEPIGLDGFGIHSENYALKIGRHPMEVAKETEKNFYRQLHATGNGYAWKEKLETYDPDYYKWTQWIFIQMFKRGLAYRAKAPVNWCPSCKTVLADEQVINGACERCKTSVEKKQMEQWFFKITSYAERLLKNLEKINWSEKVKIAQRNWIGKSESTEITFSIKDSDKKITIVTTRADTIFGATFLTLAPEHPLVEELADKIKNFSQVKKYIKEASRKTDFERGLLAKEKTGVKLEGVTVINPVNGSEMPAYVSDFVLISYGTGAIMGVPAHDQRDFDFAKKFNLPITQVVDGTGIDAQTILVQIYDEDLSDIAEKLRRISTPREYATPTVRVYAISAMKINLIIQLLKEGSIGDQNDYKLIKNGQAFTLEINPRSLIFFEAYEGHGKIINSGFLNGLDSKLAIKEMNQWVIGRGVGKPTVNYHLRDWLISRQRYWGPPIPMVHCAKCARLPDGQGWQPVPEEELPVLLPDVEDWRPKGAGKSPLASIESFVKTTCPKCQGTAERETDVSDTFLDSSWYFFRYPSTRSARSGQVPFDEKITKKWLPVDMYIGGAEHAVLHLLYSRFMTMVFKDWGLIEFEEPYKRFYAHGLLISEGAKMSKSKGNIVAPDAYISRYGADTLRCYLMFLGPFDQGGDFRDAGILGIWRFLNRVWNLVMATGPATRHPLASPVDHSSLERIMHQTIKRVTEDIRNLRYNTALAALMEYYNELADSRWQVANGQLRKHMKTMLLLLAPFAPHITEELWFYLDPKPYTPHFAKASRGRLSPSYSIHKHPWPQYDKSLIYEEEVTVVVCINGKMRDRLKVPHGQAGQKVRIVKLASESSKIQKYISGKKIKKTVFVPEKLINFVI